MYPDFLYHEDNSRRWLVVLVYLAEFRQTFKKYKTGTRNVSLRVRDNWRRERHIGEEKDITNIGHGRETNFFVFLK